MCECSWTSEGTIQLFNLGQPLSPVDKKKLGARWKSVFNFINSKGAKVLDATETPFTKTLKTEDQGTRDNSASAHKQQVKIPSLSAGVSPHHVTT